jgi:Zn-dependent peptidase ImmA (M78 family)
MVNLFLEGKAEKLLSDAGALSAIPVELPKCASFLGIDVQVLELEDNVSGFLVFKGETAHIGVNKNHNVQRNRFTTAHELGHYILHLKKGTPLFIEKKEKVEEEILFRDFTSSTGEDVKEREANAFAAALLMPRSLLKQQIQLSSNRDNPEELVKELATKFVVSTTAMNIRLNNLGVLDYDF